MGTVKVEQYTVVGYMNAQLPNGVPFHASSLVIQPRGVAAYDDNAVGDEPFLFINFPKTLEVKTFPMEPQEKGDVWAYLGSAFTGYASNGELGIERLNDAAGPLKAHFEFEVSGEGTPFKVTDGAFELQVSERAHTDEATGAAGAQVEPALEGNNGFNATLINLNYGQDGKPNSLLIVQQRDLEYGLSDLGAFIRLDTDGVLGVRAVVGNGLIAADEGSLDYSDFHYEEGVALSFVFSFSFRWKGKVYRFEKGRVKLELR